jgi:hypothetical protein
LDRESSPKLHVPVFLIPTFRNRTMRISHHPEKVPMTNLKRNLLGPTVFPKPTKLSILYFEHRTPFKKMFQTHL